MKNKKRNQKPTFQLPPGRHWSEAIPFNGANRLEMAELLRSLGVTVYDGAAAGMSDDDCPICQQLRAEKAASNLWH